MLTVPGEGEQDATAPLPPARPGYSLADQYGGEAQPPKSNLLDLTYRQAQQHDPKQSSRLLKMMGVSGVDMNLLEANLDEAEAEFSKPTFNAEEFKKKSPIMARWLEKSPHHMKVATDDLHAGKLGDLEKIYARRDNPARPLTTIEKKEMIERRSMAITRNRREAEQKTGLDFRTPDVMGDAEARAERDLAAMTDKPDPEVVKKEMADLEDEEEYIAGAGKVGFAETFKKNFRENPFFLAGFIAPAGDMIKHARLLQAVQAQEKGTETQDDIDYMTRFGRLAEAAERRGTDVWGKTAEIVGGLPAFATGFAMTGGLYRGAKVAAEQFLKNGVKAALTKSTQAMGRKAVGTVVGSAARTAAGIPRLVDTTIQNVTRDFAVTPDEAGKLKTILSKDDPDSIAKGVLKAFGTNLVENLSETTGIIPQKVTSFLKTKFFKHWVSTHPQGGIAGFIKKTQDEFGWNGMIGEMFEERVGEVMKAGLGLEDYKFPSIEQLQSELVGFAIPSIPGHLANVKDAMSANRNAKVDLEREKAIAKVYADLGISTAEPEIAGPMVEQISKDANEGTETDHRYIDPLAVKTYYEQKGVDPSEAMKSLFGTDEHYKQALSDGHDLQIPTARYDAYAAAGEDGAFWQENTVKEAGLETVTATEERLKKAQEDEKSVTEAEKAINATPEAQEKKRRAEVAEAGVKRIGEVIEQGLKESGRPRAEISSGKRLVTQVFRTLGERMNTDPWELFRSYGLTVAKGKDEGRAGAADTHYFRISDKDGGQHVEAFQAPTSEDAIQMAHEKWAGAEVQSLTDEEVQQFLPKALESEGEAVYAQSEPDSAMRGEPISTRLITSKKAPKDQTSDLLSIGKKEMMLDPESFATNVSAVTKYPNFKLDPSLKTDEQKADAFIQHIKDNLLWLYDQIPPEIRDRSKLWYDGAKKLAERWSKKYDLLDSQIAGVIAVLSPQTDWFRNVSLAQRVLDTYTNERLRGWTPEMSKKADEIYQAPHLRAVRRQIEGKTLNELKSPHEKAAWIRAYDEAHNPRDYRLMNPEGNFLDLVRKKAVEPAVVGDPAAAGWGSLPAIAKAVSIIEDGRPQNISVALGQAHKVRNFYNNIFNPNSDYGEVTSDTHAVAAGLLRPLSGDTIEVSHNLGGGKGSSTSAITGASGTYGLFADAYRLAAKERGILPREMQSITWEAGRGLFSPSFKANEKNIELTEKVWENYRHGRITIDDARAQVIALAGGIQHPDWFGSDAGVDEGAGATADARGVSGSGVPGGSTEPAAGGARGGTSAGTPGVARTFHQAKKQPVPVFHSKLRKLIEAKMPARASAEQIRGIVKDIKGEELQWLGMNEFLSANKDEKSIAKEDVLSWLEAHDLKVTEVMKGDALKWEQVGENLWSAAPFQIKLATDGMYRLTKNGRVKGTYGRLEQAKGDAEILVEEAAHRDGESVPGVKYAQYTVPGGKNYREILLTLPEGKPTAEEVIRSEGRIDASNKRKIKPTFLSSHFDEPNILAHVRFNERVDKDGNKVLFIEEVQSDWHQAGRKKGYQSEGKGDRKLEDLSREELVDILARNDRNGVWSDADSMRESGSIVTKDEALSEIRRMLEDDPEFDVEGDLRRNARTDGVPDAPFKKTWHEFAFKRMVRYAAENGFDKIAWTTGEQQAERYDLSKHISRIDYKPSDAEGTFAINVTDHDDKVVHSQSDLSVDQLEGVIGKEMAKKIQDGEGAAGRGSYKGWKTISGLDLKVGGEGMKGFYDQMLPSFANKFGKKYGAQVETMEIPSETNAPSPIGDMNATEYFEVDGTSIVDPTVDIQYGAPIEGDPVAYWEKFGVAPEIVIEALNEFEAKQAKHKKPISVTVHSMEITPELKDAALNEGFSLFQPQSGGKKNRGRITIGNASIDISLLEDADASTFAHELGHFYLEVLGDMAAREDAPQEVKDDYQAVLEWFEVKDRSEIGEDQHEQWAEGFERYLWEGKSPSAALRRAFYHFKTFLTRIYKTFLPGAKLNDRVRRVFDRLLATEEEIAEARAEYGGELYNTLTASGMDPDRAAKLAKATLDDRMAVDDRYRVRAMKDLAREEKAEYRANRARIHDIVKKEVYERQDVKLLANLQNGTLPDGSPLPAEQVPLKLWDTALEEGDYVQAPQLPEGVVGSRQDGATHPDAVADMYQFDSVGQMINALVQIGDIGKFVEDQVDIRMAEQYPPMTEEELRQAADEEVHGVDREKRLRLELEELVSKNMAAYKAGVTAFSKPPRLPNPEVIHRRAKEEIGKLPISQIKPNLYKSAEIRASREALQHALKADWEKAADAQLRQYLNFAKWKAATASREMLKKGLNLAREMAGSSDMKMAKSRDMNLVAAGRTILKEYGIGNYGDKAEDHLEALRKYDPQAYEALQPYINAALADAKDYSTATVEQFERMITTVRALWNLSSGNKKIEIDGVKVEREEAKGAMREDLKKFGTPHAKAGYHRDNTKWEDIKLWMLGAKARLRRVESWVGVMGDSFKKYVWRPIVEATDKYRVRRVAAFEKLLTAAEALGQLKNGKIEAPEIGYTFSGEGELVMALGHSGNRSNLRKSLLGREWATEDKDGVLDTSKWDRFRQRAEEQGIVRKEMYDFVQAVWNIFEDLKPDAQRAHMEMFGLPFAEITADEFQTKWGTYKGGYMPAKTDPRFVEGQAANIEEDLNGGFNNSYAWPTTGRGSTIERQKNYTRQLSLKFNLIPQHIDWALRFAHIEPRVREVARLLRDKEMRTAIAEIDPKVSDEMLTPWLQRAAAQRTEEGPRGPFDHLWRYIRRTAGLQIMALNIPNALQNLTGLSVAATKVDPHHLRDALSTYVANPAQYAAEIRGKSDMMKVLTDTQAGEMLQAVEDIILDPSTFDKIKRAASKHAYAFQRLTQNAISTIVWGGSYQQSIERGMTEKEAVQEANSVVRLTQGATNAEDIARYEAGSPFVKLFTQFGGYFNMKANLMASEFAKEMQESGLEKGAGRMLYLFMVGHMIPAALAAAIFKLMSGGWDDDDDDGYLDELMATFFGSQVKELIAMVPGVGQAVNSMIGGFTPEQYDDRVNLSPAVQAIERAVRVPGEIYKAFDEGRGGAKAAKDALSMLGFMSGIPTSPITRAAGYIQDVESGKATPGGSADYLRGLITGKRGTPK